MPQPEVDRDVRAHLPFVMNEREDRPVTRAGVDVRNQIAANTLRHVQQERGERIGEAIHRGAAGDGRRGAPVPEDTPRPAIVLHLQQEIAIVPQVATQFDCMVPPQLGRRGRHVPGAFGPVPRQ